MKFSADERVNAPIEDVFALMSSVETYEQVARNRNVMIQRKSENPIAGSGAAWTVRLALDALERDIDMEIQEAEAANRLLFSLNSGDFTGQANCQLTSLSASVTRLACDFEFRPLNLGARMLLQPLKLAKSKFDQKFAKGLTALASELEARYSRQV